MFIRFLGKNIFYLSNESNLNLAFYEFIPRNDYGSFLSIKKAFIPCAGTKAFRGTTQIVYPK